jgi:hypothetical protein
LPGLSNIKPELKREPSRYIKFPKKFLLDIVNGTAFIFKNSMFKYRKTKPSVHLMSLFISYFSRHLKVELKIRPAPDMQNPAFRMAKSVSGSTLVISVFAKVYRPLLLNVLH